MSQSSVIVGLATIIVGTVLGFVWVDRLQGTVWYFDPKYVVTLLVLLLYAAYLWLARRLRGAERAHRSCAFSILLW